MNRHQRRKYGPSTPRKPAPTARRWTAYVLAVLVLAAVVYFRVFMRR